MGKLISITGNRYLKPKKLYYGLSDKISMHKEKKRWGRRWLAIEKIMLPKKEPQGSS